MNNRRTDGLQPFLVVGLSTKREKTNRLPIPKEECL